MEITTLGLHAPCVLNPVYLSMQSDPHKTAHARVVINASYTLVLKWCRSDEVAAF